ncbi:hypothetical protein GUITHDRAFT_118777 [Guillardia theta CCMP2712]|uniref:Uncharacterized protein n=1 Tax=Guillardia theta (strain CCMP2712) TaxID=905079 RepID=L1IFL3_GUITC|nr:hypothetical protein GUITHDRAFT_118777 [Guillardia theta CCMP2712]EKX35028.1 hypothetical protein GUITHDRAFT_118777 [Guillardia theta CCMP2712]|eukprot:XP_005822008.1 hypothetical protein GUITHDRAFT_118777 [Guillardia theta CCMP2712]
MWYVNVGMKVIQTNVYEHFFAERAMTADYEIVEGRDGDAVMGNDTHGETMTRFKKAVREKKDKSGQFIIKHKLTPEIHETDVHDTNGNVVKVTKTVYRAIPGEWEIIDISDQGKEVWFLYNESDEDHSIIHQLGFPGNAWYHNSHSSSSSMYERIFEAFRTMSNNQLEINNIISSKKAGKSSPHDQKLLDDFIETNKALQKRLDQNFKIMQDLHLVENPENVRYTLDNIVKRKIKIYHHAPDKDGNGNTMQQDEETQGRKVVYEALHNRLKQIQEHFDKGRSIPREIHSKARKEEKAKEKQQASATAMDTDKPQTRRAASPPRPQGHRTQVPNDLPYW